MSTAFRRLGHDAWSCDLLPSESPFHYQDDVLTILDRGWDLAIFHPPCTYLANSGAKHLYKDCKKENGIDDERYRNMVYGALFFGQLWHADIPHVAVENPIMLGYAKKIIGRGEVAEPTQIIQPWQFGHGETKATCLWLKNLPKLEPTNIVSGREARVHKLPPSADRWKLRSLTYQGIADAMAQQWSSYLEQHSEGPRHTAGSTG